MRNLGLKEEDGALSLGGPLLALGRRSGSIVGGGNSGSVLFNRQRRIDLTPRAGGSADAPTSGSTIRRDVPPPVRLPQNQAIE